MKTLKIVLISILIMTLIGCGSNSDQKKAEEVVLKYLTAMEQNDMTTLYGCYDPDLQEASSVITGMGANALGIGGVTQENALGLAGFISSLGQEAFGVEWEINDISFEGWNLEKNKGTVTARFNMELSAQGSDLHIPCLIDFALVKKQDDWYVGIGTGEIELDEDKADIEKIAEEAQEFSSVLNSTWTGNETAPQNGGKDAGKTEGLQVSEATDFENDVTLIELRDKQGQCAGMLKIDNAGKILNYLPDFQIRPGQNLRLHHGAVWMSYMGELDALYNLDGVELINADGVPLDADSDVEWQSLIFDNGDPVVVGEKKAFDSEIWMLGFLNTDGTWWKEPFEAAELVNRINSFSERKISSVGVNCLDEGMYLVIITLFDSYNYEDLRMVYFPENDVLTMEPENLRLDDAVFVDGAATICMDGVAYIVDREMTVRQVMENVRVIGDYNQELIYVETFDGAKGFITPDGEWKFNLPEFDSASIQNTYPYENGKAAVSLAYDSSSWFTFMDDTGAFVFEPIKGEVIDASEGYVAVRNMGLYQDDGQLVVEEPDIRTAVHNGCARAEDSTGRSYHINKNGEPLYDRENFVIPSEWKTIE